MTSTKCVVTGPTSEGFSWGMSAAGEFVEGSGLPFDTPKPTTDRKKTFTQNIKMSIKD